MIMKDNKQIGFIYKNNESIDKILKDGDVVFERGFSREITSTTLPIIFNGIGKNLKDYKIYGNTKQNSTTGKNLLDYITGFNETINGTINTLSEDGTITVSGKPTSNYTRIVSKKEITDILEDGETYVLSMTNNQKYVWCEVIGVINGTNSIYYSSRASNDGVVFTIDKTTYDRYDMYIITATIANWGDSSRTISSKFQLEKGNAKTNFENYTNGVSPRPDFPQKIISLGERTINIVSTNPEDYEIGTISANNGSNQNNATRIRTKDYYPIFAGDYYISIESNEYRFINIEYYDSDKNFLYAQGGIQNNKEYNISITDSNVAFFRMVFKQKSENNIYPNEILTIKPMITPGNTKNLYEPYGYKIPLIIKGKNIFDKNSATYKNGYYINNDGVEQTTQNSGYITNYIKVKSNTVYTIQGSLKDITQSSHAYAIYFFDINKNWISRTTITTNPPYTFTTPNNCKFIQFQYRQAAYDEDTIQIEENSTATSYEAFISPLVINIYLNEPLRKIGEYSDYIDFINGKIVRNITEFILDGTRTSNIYFYTSQNTSRIQYTNNPKGRSNDTNIFCNQLLGKLNYNSDIEGLYVNGVSVVLRINKDKIGSNITSANEWFASNPLKLDYVLETPTEESIALPDIPTLNGNNVLDIETEITPSQVYIKYKSNS